MLLGHIAVSQKTINNGVEQVLRYVAGIGLAVVSCLFTVTLLLNLSGDGSLLKKCLMVVTGILLEGTKVLLLRMTKSHKVLALSFVVLSVLASFGASLVLIEGAKAHSAAVSDQARKASYGYQQAQREVEGIDQQISVLVQKINTLPPNFVTASERLNGEVADLRAKRDSAMASLSEGSTKREGISSTTSMVALFGKLSGIAGDVVTIVLSLFVAILVELGIIALLSYRPPIFGRSVEEVVGHPIPTLSPAGFHRGAVDGNGHPSSLKEAHSEVSKTTDEEYAKDSPQGPLSVSYSRPMDKFEFLEGMKNPETAPYLMGRDSTAAKLGISPYQAKVFVQELVRLGYIVAEGKRLKLGHVLPSDRTSISERPEA